MLPWSLIIAVSSHSAHQYKYWQSGRFPIEAVPYFILLDYNIIDECTSFPCQNAGTCIDTVNGYSCICPEGSTGLNCEQDIDECQSSPCMNNGSCVDMLNGYTCTCVPGYSGIHCEQDINECSSSPCQNGSTCVDGINEYSCACIAGFTGVNCEQDIDECASLPCQNGGTCVSGVNLYTCACTAGFYGINCAAINICSSSPCQNGGTCVNMLFGYLCTCLPEYTGLHCEQACFTGSPWNYTGTINLTLTGRQCQRWDSQTPHSHTCTDLQYFPETVLADAQNYCRNPESSYDTPWCFTTDAAKEWENCDVIEC
ncbi:fibropellin-3-like [Mercenaria mercenaria]|uniref:fibropellin-3-like n=1 Tax=Mercenaria mercenaria TaxID=6596 RepID=UPI00234F3F3C|nr:fibropellin-3-like [Mercenaria mercenaria]